MKVVESKELLKKDFSKYTSISINRVLFRGLEITAEETGAYISILGFIGEEVILSTGFYIKGQIKIEENKGTLYIERVGVI